MRTENLNYSELLNSIEWKSKREEILSRDNYCCTHCFNKSLIKDSIIISNGLFFVPFKSKMRIIIPELKIQIYIEIELGKLLKIREDNFLPIISVSQNNDKYYLNCIGKYNKSDIPQLIQKKSVVDQEINDKIDKISWIYVNGLHVHHNYYKYGLNPWEYPNNSLSTLCWLCHEMLHKTAKIVAYDNEDKIIGYYTPCIRCSGAGYFPQFRHVDEGICFRCKGARYEELIKEYLGSTI